MAKWQWKKRRIIGLALTLTGSGASIFTLKKSVYWTSLANSQFPPLEDAWHSSMLWVIPTALSVALLIWGLISLLATEKYWQWLKSGQK